MEYLLGMDGGGTGTKVTVADIDGSILGRLEAGALNGNGQSPGRLKETVAQMVKALEAQGFAPEGCAGLGAGVAGISNRAAGEAVRAALADAGFTCPVYLYGDHQTALEAAFPGKCGIILIAGTGSICYGRRADGTYLRVGGYGHVIDDGGSAYAIGRDMLAAIVRQEDGRGESTVLRELVFRKLQMTETEDLVGYVYHQERSKKDIAALAVLLEPAVAQGDRAALEIEGACIGELAGLALTAMRRLDGEKNLTFGGSVLLKNRRIRESLCRRLREADAGIHIAEGGQDASLGALRLLRENLAGRKC